MEHPENDRQYKGLKVNDGVEPMGSLNPYLASVRRKRAVSLSVNDYVEGILRGDVVVLSRAVTLLESVLPEHQAMAQEIVERCLPYSGNSLRIGITGVPGAGKSTSIDAFGMHVLERCGGKLAVLAVDPRKTRETIVLCEAAGYDKVFVETVGVGQSETAVYSMVDFFLLIQITGAGDELQGIKRGIMEMADGVVINKADGDNVEEAKRSAVHMRNALHLFPMPASGIRPQVLTYSGFYDLGIKEVWDMIFDYVDKVRKNGAFEERRYGQSKYWMYEAIDEQLRMRFRNAEGVEAMLTRYEQMLLAGKITSFAAATRMLEYYDALKRNGHG